MLGGRRYPNNIDAARCRATLSPDSVGALNHRFHIPADASGADVHLLSRAVTKRGILRRDVLCSGVSVPQGSTLRAVGDARHDPPADLLTALIADPLPLLLDFALGDRRYAVAVAREGQRSEVRKRLSSRLCVSGGRPLCLDSRDGRKQSSSVNVAMGGLDG